MVTATPDVLDAKPAPLPEGLDEPALLDAFLSGIKSLVALCLEFRMSLGQFRAWLNTPRIRACLDAAADLTARREPFTASAARQTAIQGFSAIARALPRDDPAAPPDLKRDALHARMRESARKAAGQLLRTIEKLHTAPPGQPSSSPPARGTGVPLVSTEPPPSPRPTPGRAAERPPAALTRAMDTRHPLAAAAGR